MSTFKLKRIKDGKDFPVGDISMLIGRSESCDIRVVDGHPSREHARIAQRPNGLLVQDLHSTNGTFVNNHAIDEATLVKDGDLLKFGDEVFCVQLQQQVDATVCMKSPFKSAASETIVEEDDDEEEDSTSVIHIYPMPPGWSDFNRDESGKPTLDPHKKQAIDRYVEKHRTQLAGKPGIVLLAFAEENLPIIKCLTGYEGSKWSLGRASESAVHIDHACISKHHADIIFEAGVWCMRDAGSTNGMSVAGQKLQEVALEDECVIKIVSVEILIRIL